MPGQEKSDGRESIYTDMNEEGELLDAHRKLYLNFYCISGYPYKALVSGDPNKLFSIVELSLKHWSLPYRSKKAQSCGYSMAGRLFYLGFGNQWLKWFLIMEPKKLSERLPEMVEELNHKLIEEAMDKSTLAIDLARDLQKYSVEVFKLGGLVGSGVLLFCGLNKPGGVTLNSDQWSLFQQKFMENFAAIFEHSINVDIVKMTDWRAESDEEEDPDVVVVTRPNGRRAEVEAEVSLGHLTHRNILERFWKKRLDRKKIRFFPVCWQQRFGNLQGPTPLDELRDLFLELNGRLKEGEGLGDVLTWGSYQQYSQIKNVFHHSQDQFELGKGKYTAALCFSRKGATQAQV
ncbi:hypothetical protein DFH27DRAFT_527158 [Peziza echinospora]|nr:hypothetical protein DFH27DRAFT_527158 [Peziza echinospora]